MAQLIANGGKTHLAVFWLEAMGPVNLCKRQSKGLPNDRFESTLIRLEETVSEEELLAEVKKINQNQDIDGLIVQLPLPKHIDEMKVTETIF